MGHLLNLSNIAIVPHILGVKEGFLKGLSPIRYDLLKSNLLKPVGVADKVLFRFQIFQILTLWLSPRSELKPYNRLTPSEFEKSFYP